MSERHILVVGGGFTGLAAAWRLAQRPGARVVVCERGDHLGGLAGGFKLRGTSLERAYHHLFRTDTFILDLVRELGIEDKLQWRESSLAIYRDGRAHPFMTPLDLLRFRPVGLAGRLRLGLVALYLQRRRNWHSFARETAWRWMRRACGADAMNAVWEPLLRGKFDRHAEHVAMAWLWARIHIRANSRDPASGREMLGYFRGGFAVVIDRLESALRARGVEFHFGTTVDGLSSDKGKVLANLSGKNEVFDACLFTGPSPTLARLLPPGESGFARLLETVDYLGAVCLIFVTPQKLGDHYWVNVNEPDAPFLVFLRHTRLVDAADYEGREAYYLGAYRPHDHDVFKQTDDELADRWLAYVRRMFPQFDPASVEEKHVFRFRHAQHVVDADYEQKIPPHRTPLKGLWLANFSQIFPEDRGTNYAVLEGLKVADLLWNELTAQP